MNDNTETPGQTESPPPERIGPYHIEAQLGAGGMGTVYLGKHDETGQLAAVKVLPASMAREQGFVARFNREIEAMRQVSSANSNIVALYDSGEDHGTYYYAMEYVPGETLTSRIEREKRIPWRDVIDIGTQICKALKAAHNAGIIHRDLKPSNLIIREDGVVKLADFGIAQVFASNKLTMTGGILGTAEYMSPEQAQGKRATRQSDIYSLGALLYVMLTGRPPFTGKTTLEIAQKHKFGQFDSPRRIVPEIPHWLDEVVCQCLAKKPEDRYPDAYVLGLRLQEIPRKVDLSKSEGMLAGSRVDSTSETEAAHGGVDPAAIGGTFVRDMMRAELEKQEHRGLLNRWFDNVWVLLTLLLLLLIGTAWLFLNSRPTPEKLFARGESLMSRPAGPAWDAAQTQCFQPLLEEDAELWQPRVQPYLDRIAEYQLERTLLDQPSLNSSSPSDEPEQILRRARVLEQMGDFEAAREQLEALLVLLGDSPDYAAPRQLAQRMLEQIKTPEPRQIEFLEAVLIRAAQLEESGKQDEADRVREAIKRLYGENSSAIETHESAGSAPASGR